MRFYSEGLYVAVSCNDYPQPYSVTAPFAKRERQLRRSYADLRRRTPDVFSPFSVREWTTSPYGYYDSCLRWPSPSRRVPAIPDDATYPDVPTLVLAGDLDSLTSPEGARDTAAAFPRSTYVEVANTTHVTALVDFDTCTSLLARRFVRTRSAGDTSCADDYHENRLVPRFTRTAAAQSSSGRRATTARVAAATVGDVVARWLSMYGERGVGLHGGSFTTRGGGFTDRPSVARWRLREVRWVRDVAVSGEVSWNRRTGEIRSVFTTRGPGASPGRLRLSWNDLDRHARARAAGVLGGRTVRFDFPAP